MSAAGQLSETVYCPEHGSYMSFKTGAFLSQTQIHRTHYSLCLLTWKKAGYILSISEGVFDMICYVKDVHSNMRNVVNKINDSTHLKLLNSSKVK